MVSKVTVLKTKPESVLEDYAKLLDLSNYKKFISKDHETILKLNLSWSKYFPSCSTEPWQLEGVIKKMQKDGYKKLIPVENRTVVTDIWKGAAGNKWLPILKKYKLKYQPLTDVKWIDYKPKHEMLALHKIFRDGHQIPEMFVGTNVVHFPTVKCVHGDTEIFLSDGSLVRIDDLVEGINFQKDNGINLNNDQVTISQHGIFSISKTGVIMTTATHFWKTKLENNLIYIKLRTGRNVKTSTVHPFLTQRGWVKAEDLEKNDRVAIPRVIDIGGERQLIPNFLKYMELPKIENIHFTKGKKHSIEKQKQIVKEYIDGKTTVEIAKKLKLNPGSIWSILKRNDVPIRWVRKIPKIPSMTTPEFWMWLGLILSEGYIYNCNGTIRTSFSNTHLITFERFRQLTFDLFGLKVKKRKDGYVGTPEYYFDCNLIKPLYNLLEIKIPTNSQNKVIPSMLFKCTKEEIGAFLSGYIDGDGTVGKDGLHITSKSENLVNKLQLLLVRLGVNSFINKIRSRATNSSMDYEDYWNLSVYAEDLIMLDKYLKLNINEKKENIDKIKLNIQATENPKTNYDTIPVDSITFRKVREGLGFTQHSSRKPSSVNSIENGHSLPTRSIFNYFIKLFKDKDKNKSFSKEIEYFEFLANPQIVWDYIKIKKEVEPDTLYLYDLTVPELDNFIGNGIILHNTHGHTKITLSLKNAFGGLITEKRHHCHKMIHEILVDLLQIQKEIHKGIFAVADGTVCGDGKGPRTMIPRIKNYILAAEDQVAIDAVSAKMMGYDPMKIPFIKIAHDKGLGIGDVDQIDIVGENISKINFGFKTYKSPVIYFDQLFRKRSSKFVEKLLFHTPLFNLCIFGSEFYHDYVWYPTIGKYRINQFKKTGWGKLFDRY